MRRSSPRSSRRVDRGGRARPDSDDGAFRAGCRTFIEAGQRLDFVSGLAEDLREGRRGVPMETLKRFSVTMEDLAAGRESAGVRELVGDQVRAARAGLSASRELSALVPALGRALVEALVEIDSLTADAALRRGAGLLSGSAFPRSPGTPWVLARAFRRARAER
ncbi:squalene/phytoene synthase family protein [Streptomyces heilongjiangensis]|uniref:Squalene/phytoene synthase family protein n=1 Tax=Streptomyces heilongjiangensis TaxID=945052 RepID=A0ABW1B718_9ACTN|nr:squalene/phytoene synthase family protein [Streptomyces heilongjiangensis]MDC2947389.1 squalene/phytoene synthase family protein [Streptomyces heilongjiangensis]